MSTKAKSTINISIITFLSRITGLARTAALGAALGQTISTIADAYNLANFMPNQIYELVMGGILTSVFIPVFVEYKSQKSEKEAWEVANRILTLAVTILIFMTIVCWVFTPFFVRIQALKTSEDFRKLANFFFYFFAPQIIFYGIYIIFGAMLNTYDQFIIPSIVSVLNNIVVIATVGLYYYYPDHFGNKTLAIGTTLGIAVMALGQLPALYKLGWRYQWLLDFKDPVVKKITNLATPMFFYVGLNQVALTIRNNFADAWGQGGITAMQNGFIFFQLPYGLFSVSIMTVLYPTLSKQAVDKDMEKFRQSISQGIRWSAFVIIPCAVGYLFLSHPIIKIILQHGKFNAVDTDLTATVLACYALALLPYTLTLLFTRAFYALQDTKTPLIVVFLGVILTTVGCFLLVKPFGVAGIALAYGAQYIGMAVFFWILLRKKLKRFEGRRIVTSLIKSIIASTVMGIVIYYLNAYLTHSVTDNLVRFIRLFFADIIILSVTIFIGIIIYIGMTWLFKAEEIISIRNWIQRRRIEL